ncbi:MAG: type ISP restriction/modification enzyme [Methylococcales bacterium]|nr:type ISP restriction/modification enzyme [Methylococcales bacterium]
MSLDDFLLATEKRAWLKHNSLRGLARAGEFKGITPNGRGDWLNQAREYEDWNRWLPIASKESKAGKDGAIFKLYSLGVVTARDEWIYDNNAKNLERKIKYLIDIYNKDVKKQAGKKTAEIASDIDYSIKWTRAVKADLSKGIRYKYTQENIIFSIYRPFTKKLMYFSGQLNEMQSLSKEMFGKNADKPNICIGFMGNDSPKPFAALAFIHVIDLNCLSPAAGGTKCLPLYQYDKDGSRHDNITDWALKQFQAHYENPALVPTRGVGMPSHRAAVQDAARLQLHSHAARGNEIKGGREFIRAVGGKARINSRPPWFVSLNKTDIFNYVYAVLHDPRYREKFALNLKAEFPRIPFHPDFAAWAALGAKLIKLHAEFEHVEPWEFERVESSVRSEPVEGLESFMLQGASTKKTAKTKLKADKIKHCIEIDSQTTLANIPPEAWQYQLGNRSALEWVLDQYKEKTPKDPTIREKFNTYRFADHKEHVIELLAKVCRVSVETMALIEAIQALTWD